MSNRKSERGFSLIELLIVVTVIGIIVAIAVPSLIGARSAAEQASAVSNLRMMVTDEQMFWVQRGRFGRLDEINQLNNGGLGQFSGATLKKQNYTYQMTPSTPTDAQLAYTFLITGSGPGPNNVAYMFSADQSGVISQVSP